MIIRYRADRSMIIRYRLDNWKNGRHLVENSQGQWVQTSKESLASLVLYYRTSNNLYGSENEESLTKLGKLLGKDYWNEWRSGPFELPEEVRSLLLKLNGPYGKIIMKALEAKRGSSTESSLLGNDLSKDGIVETGLTKEG